MKLKSKLKIAFFYMSEQDGFAVPKTSLKMKLGLKKKWIFPFFSVIPWFSYYLTYGVPLQ